MSSQKEQAETAEDIAYSAFLSEYDHCVQRSEKLDKKTLGSDPIKNRKDNSKKLW